MPAGEREAVPDCAPKGLRTLRFSNHGSWELHLEVPEDLNFAVAVRVVRDFPVDEMHGPPAAPLDDGFELSVAPSDLDRAAAAREWFGWWSKLSSFRSSRPNSPPTPQLDPPDFASLIDAPSLRRTATETWPAFHEWWDGPPGRKRALCETLLTNDEAFDQLVGDYEHRVRRPCRAFRFDVDVLATESTESLVIVDAYAQIGVGLITDPFRLSSWFRRVVQRIG